MSLNPPTPQKKQQKQIFFSVEYYTFFKSPSPCAENSLIIMVCLLFIQKYTLIPSQWPMIYLNMKGILLIFVFM